MANPKQTLAKKKKKWYTVVAPKEMNGIVIGETPASDLPLLKGRVLKANLMTLTNEMKKQNMTATFRITNVKETTAETELTAYNITPAHVKRLSKRAKDKVCDSFKCETKDGKKIAIKPLLLLRAKLQRGALTSLRMKAREFLTNEAKKRTFMELVSSVLSAELQKGVKQAVKNVYPISMAEIRVLELA